jgi:hypothetical protein
MRFGWKLQVDDYMPCECRCGCTAPSILSNYLCSKCQRKSFGGARGHGMAAPDAEASWESFEIFFD